MAIDFSSLQATPAQTGKIDFSTIGGIPAVGSYDPEDETSALGAAGRGAAGMIPLGDQAYAGVASLASHKPYLKERKNLDELVQKDIEEHPTARLAGQAAGVIAPIALTAGVAAPETILGAAGQGALFGGASGAGKAIDTLASGGSGAEAAGDVALGAGLGAAGGAAGQATGKVLGKVASTVLPSAEEVNAHAIAGVLGGTPRQFRALPGKNPITTINEMGDVMRRSTIDGKPLIESLDQFPTRIEKFIKLQKQSGKLIGDMTTDAHVQPMAVEPLEQGLLSSMNIASPEEKAHMASVIDHLKTYAVDGNIPFSSLQKLKTEVGDRAFQGQGNPVLQNAYHVLNDAQDAELEKISGLINKPAFDEAKKQYQMTSRAIPMLKMAVAKEVAGKSNLVVPGAALVTGHPMVAAGALLKPRLSQIASGAAFKAPEMLPASAGNVAARVPSMAGAATASQQLPTGGLNIHHPALAAWKPVFDKNAANAKDEGEVKKSHAVTDFILSQRDPAYAQAKQKMAEDKEATPEPLKMSEGGVVPEKRTFGEPIEGVGSTLKGLAEQLKNPTHEPKPEALPTTTAQKFHEPFNGDFADKLRAFMAKQKEIEDAEPR